MAQDLWQQRELDIFWLEVIALIVTPEAFPLSYEVMSGKLLGVNSLPSQPS